ncbi:sigma-70 family RNA polymerase sigma factor [Tessaracoccus terricola]
MPAARGATPEELERLLRDGDLPAAADVVAQLSAAGAADEALSPLGRHVAAADGEDRAALELLVETLDACGVIHRIAGSMLLDRTAVDDVAQESLISVVQSIGSYRGDSAFTTWLHPIVKRRVADHLRRRRDAATLCDDEELLPSARMSSMIATRATVQDLLRQLPELYRRPVTMRDIDGMAYREIAEQLGRSIGTVKAQISRGRAMLAGAAGDLDGRQ